MFIIQTPLRVNVVAWVIVVTMDPDLHCRIFVVSPVCEFRGDVIALALRVLGLRVPRARGDDNKTLFAGKAPFILSRFFLGFWVRFFSKSGAESGRRIVPPGMRHTQQNSTPNHVRTSCGEGGKSPRHATPVVFSLAGTAPYLPSDRRARGRGRFLWRPQGQSGECARHVSAACSRTRRRWLTRRR